VNSEISSKKRLVAFVLCWTLGYFGVHRFYVGKTGTGILWLLTVGLLGVGVLVDFIMILVGAFKDAEGKKLVEWT
jgi:TM2 domain-containing membrane protein YozV